MRQASSYIVGVAIASLATVANAGEVPRQEVISIVLAGQEVLMGDLAHFIANSRVDAAQVEKLLQIVTITFGTLDGYAELDHTRPMGLLIYLDDLKWGTSFASQFTFVGVMPCTELETPRLEPDNAKDDRAATAGNPSHLIRREGHRDVYLKIDDGWAFVSYEKAVVENPPSNRWRETLDREGRQDRATITFHCQAIPDSWREWFLPLFIDYRDSIRRSGSHPLSRFVADQLVDIAEGCDRITARLSVAEDHGSANLQFDIAGIEDSAFQKSLGHFQGERSRYEALVDPEADFNCLVRFPLTDSLKAVVTWLNFQITIPFVRADKSEAIPDDARTRSWQNLAHEATMMRDATIAAGFADFAFTATLEGGKEHAALICFVAPTDELERLFRTFGEKAQTHHLGIVLDEYEHKGTSIHRVHSTGRSYVAFLKNEIMYASDSSENKFATRGIRRAIDVASKPYGAEQRLPPILVDVRSRALGDWMEGKMAQTQARKALKDALDSDGKIRLSIESDAEGLHFLIQCERAVLTQASVIGIKAWWRLVLTELFDEQRRSMIKERGL